MTLSSSRAKVPTSENNTLINTSLTYIALDIYERQMLS